MTTLWYLHERPNDPEHYDSTGDIARMLGVHCKTVTWWCQTRHDIPEPDITLGPVRFRGWLPHRRKEWQRWYRANYYRGTNAV